MKASLVDTNFNRHDGLAQRALKAKECRMWDRTMHIVIFASFVVVASVWVGRELRSRHTKRSAITIADHVQKLGRR